MLCSKCKKRPAVVFISTNKDDASAQGLCIICAKELGVKPVANIMDKMGITDEDLELMQDQLDEFMTMGFNGDLDENNGFVPGGAPAFPSFFNSMISNPFNEKENINGVDEENTSKKDNYKKVEKKKPEKHKRRKHIDTYCYNLTKRARDGELDRIVGRDKEISRVIQILSRRTKNNPCLIGEPGVGKTAIAEGLAIRIANGDVPYRLKYKEVQLLDLTALVAGTQFRGQFESRIKGLVEEVKDARNIILFIDEVHNLVSAGDAEGSMNAANILKPALSRGEIQVIGATTFSEYSKYIEKDSALERRFQPVTVIEPSIDDTVDVLLGIKLYYENYHRVKIPNRLIRECVNLSERYITDRFLPDKSIDLLDEACAYSALRNKKMEEYDKLNEKIKEYKDQEEQISSEKENIDYEKLADIRCELAKLEQKLNAISPSTLNNEVNDDDIAHVLEVWTGIPSSRIKQSQLNKLSKIEENIRKKIVGQDEGIKALAAAVKRNRVQISPRRRPASFIFVGPTGVGKTEMVKILSTELFDSPETLIRLDMSEFMEKHSVSKIIGSPPGYVGYDEAGQITEKVRRRPYSVLLFDEIEKAHPDVMNILLQILDEGKITDSHGRTVNFENTVIVMTSNAGSEKKDGSVGFAKSQFDISREKAMRALKEFLRPEFLSRVDEIVVFRNLNEDNYKDIARLMLNEYVSTLAEKGISFKFDTKSLKFIAKRSIGGKSGARDIRNFIRKNVEDKIASAIIDGENSNIKEILLSADEDLILNIY